jgi:hypothetical protein
MHFAVQVDYGRRKGRPRADLCCHWADRRAKCLLRQRTALPMGHAAGHAASAARFDQAIRLRRASQVSSWSIGSGRQNR